MEATEKRAIESESCGGQDWIETELAASTLPDSQGRPVYFTTCGINPRSSLALTLEGLPLVLTAVKFGSRKAIQGRKAKRNAYNAPIEEKESVRWLENLRSSTELLGQPQHCVHVGDPESDFFDLFGAAEQLGTHFLVRTRADRLANGGPETVAEAIGRTARRGLYRIAVRNRKGEKSEAMWEIRYRRMRLQTPRGKKKRYPELMVTVIEARERETSPDRERIDWKLITDLTVSTRLQAVEKVQWYALRRKIEVFHKIRKSGCRAEQARLRTAPQLVNLLAVFRILSWRIFWLTMTNRIDPDADPGWSLRIWSCAFWIVWPPTSPLPSCRNTCSRIIGSSWRDWAVTWRVRQIRPQETKQSGED
jgi:hypothetical protein